MTAGRNGPPKIQNATKKEMIVAWARHDPFLKIEDIAQRVKTTARYVRTALSEANISLTQLRERYARTMEHRLQYDRTTLEHDASFVHEKVDTNTTTHTSYAVGVEQTVHTEYANLLHVPADRPLLVFTQLQCLGDKTRAVHRIVTHQSLQFDQHHLAGKQPLRKTLRLTEGDDITIHNHWMQVAPADAVLAEQLEVEPQSPVVQCGHVMKSKDVPVAVECFLFAAYETHFLIQAAEHDEWFTVEQVETEKPSITQADGA